MDLHSSRVLGTINRSNKLKRRNFSFTSSSTKNRSVGKLNPISACLASVDPTSVHPEAQRLDLPFRFDNLTGSATQNIANIFSSFLSDFKISLPLVQKGPSLLIFLVHASKAII